MRARRQKAEGRRLKAVADRALFVSDVHDVGDPMMPVRSGINFGPTSV